LVNHPLVGRSGVEPDISGSFYWPPALTTVSAILPGYLFFYFYWW